MGCLPACYVLDIGLDMVIYSTSYHGLTAKVCCKMSKFKWPYLWQKHAYHGSNASRAMVMWPPFWKVTDSPFNEQTRTNMSQPRRRPGTAAGDDQHVLQRCGVGNISKHYGVGHGSVPCRPLFCLLYTFLSCFKAAFVCSVAAGLSI